MNTLTPDLYEEDTQLFHPIAISTMAWLPHFCEAL